MRGPRGSGTKDRTPDDEPWDLALLPRDESSDAYRQSDRPLSHEMQRSARQTCFCSFTGCASSGRRLDAGARSRVNGLSGASCARGTPTVSFSRALPARGGGINVLDGRWGMRVCAVCWFPRVPIRNRVARGRASLEGLRPRHRSHAGPHRVRTWTVHCGRAGNAPGRGNVGPSLDRCSVATLLGGSKASLARAMHDRGTPGAKSADIPTFN